MIAAVLMNSGLYPSVLKKNRVPSALIRHQLVLVEPPSAIRIMGVGNGVPGGVESVNDDSNGGLLRYENLVSM